MQSSANFAPSPRSSEFAGVLMGLNIPEAKKPPGRDFDGLEDDIATLTYERAVRRHGRYRSGAPIQIPHRARDSQLQVTPPPPEASASKALIDRRSASVTVRLCPAESERLHLRAAESGLTMSEYLRSCVFEVESLRAEVKETLSALRAMQGQKEAARPPWWRRIFLFQRGEDTAA